MKLRVLSLNAWALAAPFARDTARRVRALGAALAGLEPDVAALQEVWTRGAREELSAAGRRAGLAHVWHHPATLGGSGLFVLARRPLRGARLHRFALAGVAERVLEADYLGGKGFVELEMETPFGPLTLIDTHLQAAYTERDRDPHRELRAGQVVQLAARLREIESPLVLAGDLNFRESTEEHAILTGLAGVADVAALLDRRQDTVLADNPYVAARGGGAKRIDYLFVRDGRAAGVAPLGLVRVLDGALEIEGRPAAYSDHAGLLAELEVRAGGAPSPPADPAAAAEARALLEGGARRVRERHGGQRVVGVTGVALASVLLAAARRSAVTRRRFLAGTLGACAGLFGAGRLALAEWLRPAELAGYRHALELLDGMEAGEPR